MLSHYMFTFLLNHKSSIIMSQKYILILSFAFITTSIFGQLSESPLHLVLQKKQQNTKFEESDLLQISTISKAVESLGEENAMHEVLRINSNQRNTILNEKPDAISIMLPFQGTEREVLLVKTNLFSDDFQVTESATNRPVDVDLGVHYRGIIADDKTSIAALSIYKDELIGLFSDSQNGNLVLGKLEGANWINGEHVIYDDANILDNFELDCGTEDGGIGYTREELQNNNGRALSDCVRFYFEVDNDITNSKGGTSGATNFVTGMYNQVAAIYSNENINTVISEIFVWTTNSPYNSSTSGGMLSQFQNFRTNWNGDLAQLLSYKASGGIAAGFNGICNTNRAASMTFSSINQNYNNFPNYSWNIMVISHEFGHVFGSRHTHACVWNGNNTAIDGCSGNTEGSCSLPGIPSQGGTIMSYCHITGVGINFNEGFGPQPGNVIRNRVDNGDCLVACGPPTCDDGIQNGDETGVDCGGPDCPACPTCDDGIQNGDETGVDCGGPDCAPCPCFENELLLTILLDNYPEETTWDIKDDNGTVMASGGAYGSLPDGSTVVENICLPDGCFDFTIYDSFGDGICCSYGVGNYVLTEIDGTVLAAGGAFGSQEITNFCISNDPPPPTCTDLELTINLDFLPIQTTWNITDSNGNTIFSGGPYSDQSGVVIESLCLNDGCYTFTIFDSGNNGLCCRAGNGNYSLVNTLNGELLASGSDFDSSESTSFCLNDNPPDPTCDDGIQNGDETGVDCGGTVCPPCNTCNDGIQNGDEEGVDCGGSCPNVCPTCDDGIQNGDEEGVDCGGSNCPPCDSGCPTIDDEDFEINLGIWNDGGSDCHRNVADAIYAFSGNYCVRLRDNTSSSNMTTDPLDLSSYDEIVVDFTYITRSMENGEDFWLQISTNGNTYTTVKSYVSNVDFSNDVREFDQVTIPGPFTSNTTIRFRCDASNNSDWVYIDDVKISESCNGNDLIGGTINKNIIEVENAEIWTAPISNFNLFPNPTSDKLNIRFTLGETTPVQIVVSDMNGKMMSNEQYDGDQGNQERRIDVQSLESGIYFLYVITAKEKIAKKFVVTKQ